MDSPGYGFELPLLLIGAFRNIIDELHEYLGDHGHRESRPAHAFALQSIGGDVVSVTELAGRLNVTRQAAAKTIARLEQLRYVERKTDRTDARSSLISLTPRARELLHLSAVFFERKKSEWSALLGDAQLNELFLGLSKLAPDAPLGDLIGWISQT